MSYQDLDQLSGEVLPERVLMSTAVPPAVAGIITPTPVVTSDDGVTVAYACQYTQHSGAPGILVWTGLAPAPGYSITCMPAAIAT